MTQDESCQMSYDGRLAGIDLVNQ